LTIFLPTVLPPEKSAKMVAAPASPVTATHDLPIDFNRELFNAIVDAVPKALTMCGGKARCVGVSRMPSKQHGQLTGLIGAHGRVSGFIAVNMSTRLALHMVDGLLGERFPDLCPQVIDSAGEVTNIIVGGIKSALSRGEWAFTQITVPSVVVGDGYQVAFATGLELLEVCFEVHNPEAIMASDRMLHVTLSLLKL
jgi:chemotaxis protein CheX